ncbi:zinc metalloprotease [Taibaiella koreensis]|uniref:hypothetical protein n=1 Tax=Taibaiella koreensis TaxID=1268548 RepID=UPI0013C2FE8A|nr:hypothetical protein [Taibaiella koreensis]
MGNIIFKAKRITEQAPAVTWIAEEGDAQLQAAGKVNSKGENGVDLLIGDTPLRPPEELAARCLISFRPHSRWNGAFGFDWLRTGDTGMKGDTWYHDIIGYYTYPEKNGMPDFCNEQFHQSTKEYDALVQREFKTFNVPWKQYGGGKPYLYCVPYLSLLPENDALLTLKLEIEEAPDRFEWVYSEDKFTLSGYEGLPLTPGKTELANTLSIRCLDYFDTDEFIEVYAVKGEERSLAGRLTVVRNAPKYHRKMKVLFVRVSSDGRQGRSTGEEQRLKKYLSQAYVTVEVQYANMVFENHARLRQLLEKETWNLFRELDQTLAGKKTAGGKAVGSTFDGYLRVYFLPETLTLHQCGSEGYLLGQAADIPQRKSAKKPAVIILDIQATCKATGTSADSGGNTVTHELLHASGFQHSFVNGSKYVFKQYSTDNIMDYYNRHTTRIKGIQLFKWQWDQLKKML